MINRSALTSNNHGRHLLPIPLADDVFRKQKRCHSVRQARERRKRLVLGNLSLQPENASTDGRNLASCRALVAPPWTASIIGTSRSLTLASNLSKFAFSHGP